MRDRVQFFSKNIFVGMIEKGVELKKTESCENKKKMMDSGHLMVNLKEMSR